MSRAAKRSDADELPKIRWIRLILVTLLGLGFGAAPFFLAAQDSRFGDWHAVLSATLTNLGTTIVLVGVVLVLERGLVGRVGRAAAASTERVVEERTEQLRSENRELATELSELRKDFERAAATDLEERTAPLRDVVSDVSFDSIAAALETANDLDALFGGVVVVPMVTPSDSPELVAFDWRYQELRGDDWLGTGEYVPAIRVSYVPFRNPSESVGLPVVEVLWTPTESSLDMLLALQQEMRRRGFGQEAKLVGPDLLANVGRALADAVAGRTAEEGAWVEGRLSEWLADGWAVTEQGLVSRDHGRIRRSDFPPLRGVAYPITYEPAPPEGVSEPFWRFAVRRGRMFSNNGHASPAGASRPGGEAARPFTPETSPRKP